MVRYFLVVGLAFLSSAHLLTFAVPLAASQRARMGPGDGSDRTAVARHSEAGDSDPGQADQGQADGDHSTDEGHAGMHVAVEHDRVRIGPHEFVPRFATFLPDSLVVPAGETRTLSGDLTYDAIEVGGTLRIAPGTRLRFTHLLVLPGGYLEVGTASNPICETTELIVRDVPLNTTRDPFQWGNGLLNFGAQSRVGCAIEKSFAELAADAPVGASSVALVSVPAGWKVGDELLFPDLRQVRGDAPRREPAIRIADIQGSVLSLSQPLQFEHASIADPDGNPVLRPRVANLTRSIVVRSENPAGTRGHTANIGGASWDIRYNQYVGLGRTTFDDLDNTTVDETGIVTHIGTNQIAKYASHDHHAGSSLAVRQNIGNSYLGTGGSKWAHVVHGTHDTLVEDNVCVDFQGGCFVTEDGYEVRNVFRGNVAAYSIGNGRSVRDQINPRRGHDSPGGGGSGFWHRGLGNTWVGNESWNNVVGFNLFNQDHVAPDSRVPTAPGGEPDVVLDLPKTVPVLFKDNIALANSSSGVEYWAVGARFQNEGLVSAHNRSKQVDLVNSGANHGYFRNVTLLAAGGVSLCISSSEAYTTTVEVDGGLMAGCEVGINRGGASAYMRLRNLTMQNVIDISYGRYPVESLFENVLHKPFGKRPPQYIRMAGNGSVWQVGEPLPNQREQLNWLRHRGSQHVIKNWQGTGQDYQLFENQSKRSAPAWPAANARVRLWAPEADLTMGELWDKYGLAYQGDVVGDAEAVALEGLVNGVARRGTKTALGVPRVVMTYPNMLSPAEISSSRRGDRDYVRMYFILTGDYASANEYAVVVVDDGDPLRLAQDSGEREDQRGLESGAIAPGLHTVRTWREDLEGNKIAESELTFQYFVAEPGESLDAKADAAAAKRGRSD